MTTATVIGIIVGYLLVGFALDVFYLAIKFATAEDYGTLFLNIFIWPLLLLLFSIFAIVEQMPRFFKFIEKLVTYDEKED